MATLRYSLRSSGYTEDHINRHTSRRDIDTGRITKTNQQTDILSDIPGLPQYNGNKTSERPLEHPPNYLIVVRNLET